MKRRFALLALAAGVFGCEPETLTVAETDLVITIREPGADFSRYRTYALTDTVTDLCEIDPPDRNPIDGLGGAGGRPSIDLPDVDVDADANPDCSPLPSRFDDVVLDELERNMDALGYERVALEESPDLVVTAGTVVRSEWYYVPGYVWCDPYYYYYCWYPSAGYVYEFSKASVLVNMIDTARSPEGQATSVWFAGLNGAYQQSAEYTGTERIQMALDRAFEQSPYLADGGAQ